MRFECNDAFGRDIIIGEDWEEHEFWFPAGYEDSISQIGWGYEPNDGVFDPTLVLSIQLQPRPSSDFWIDNFRFFTASPAD